jgi:ATP-binding protein involved in chromosome partitioning
MMNTTQRPMIDDEKKVIPPSAYGVKCLSMGLLVDANEAMIWRGPMVMGVVRQFLQDTRWGELDVLVVDLPPGTGDVQLTLVQAVSLDGAVIVSTPQEVALADAVRGIEMFRKLEVPLLGVVQNMAYYQLPDGTRDHVFGEGGAARVAAQQGCDVLVELPLQTSIRRGADAGLPAVLGSDAVAATFRELGRKVAERLGLGA